MGATDLSQKKLREATLETFRDCAAQQHFPKISVNSGNSASRCAHLFYSQLTNWSVLFFADVGESGPSAVRSPVRFAVTSELMNSWRIVGAFLGQSAVRHRACSCVGSSAIMECDSSALQYSALRDSTSCVKPWTWTSSDSGTATDRPDDTTGPKIGVYRRRLCGYEQDEGANRRS